MRTASKSFQKESNTDRMKTPFSAASVCGKSTTALAKKSGASFERSQDRPASRQRQPIAQSAGSPSSFYLRPIVNQRIRLKGAARRGGSGDLVPGRGLEPLRIAPPDPKSGASANFATLANRLRINHA